MPVLVGRRKFRSSKRDGSNCLLYNQAVTVICLFTAVSMPVLDGSREWCTSKTNYLFLPDNIYDTWSQLNCTFRRFPFLSFSNLIYCPHFFVSDLISVHRYNNPLISGAGSPVLLTIIQCLCCKLRHDVNLSRCGTQISGRGTWSCSVPRLPERTDSISADTTKLCVVLLTRLPAECTLSVVSYSS